MIQSNLIWIPSLQEFKRFSEITTRDHRILTKSMHSDLEFIYTLNELIKEKSMENVDINRLTLIDKYIICLYLRIFSIGNKLSLSISCPTCGVEFSHNMDINQFMESGIDVLDKVYDESIDSENFSVDLGIPTIGNEYDIAKHLETNKIKRGSLDSNLTHNVISHIKSLTIKTPKQTTINFSEISIDDSIKIIKSIPITLFNKIQNEFISPITDKIHPKILNIPCKTKTCKNIDLELNLNNINDLLKLMFQESPVKILEEIYLLGKYGNANPFFIESITPIERELIIDAQIRENKSKDSKEAAPLTIGQMKDMGFE